jgi:ribonuclease E/ribonuclease G
LSIDLVVDRLGEAIAIAVLDAGALVDLATVDSRREAIEDRFFLVHVTGIEAAIDGAFLDHGSSKPGFIAGKDARFRRGLSKRVSIKHCLESGEWLVVQGRRAAEEDKGARFTTDLRLEGPSLVFRPNAAEVTTSGAVRGAEREALLERGHALLERCGLEEGLVLRRPAALQDDASLAHELKTLADSWQKIARLPQAKERRPGPLPLGPSPLARLLWRSLELGPARLVVADDALKAETRRLVEALPPAARPAIEALPGHRTAFAQTGVDAALAEAMAQEVGLAKGGRLIIEETAACVAIDVDSGGRPALEVDLEAAAIIGRLVRLRNLGGTLIVDFVDLQAKQDRQRVENALRRAFRDDPLPVQIYPMSPLGIVQISRAKRGGSVLSAGSRICPTCAGSGRVASP